VEKGVKYTINIWTFNQLKPEFNGNAKKGPFLFSAGRRPQSFFDV